MDIAVRFCKYFTYIGPNLASALPTVNSTVFRSFLGSRDYPPIILKPIDTRELENICSLFSPRKAPGKDNTSMRVISAPLANIINLSQFKGFFPDKLKINKVNPIYKTENRSLFVIINQFLCCQISQNSLKRSCTIAYQSNSVCRNKQSILSPSVWF